MSVYDRHGIFTIGLNEPYPHQFVARAGNVLAHIVRAYRKFTMAAVHENRELDAAWPADVYQCIHGCTNGAAGIEHVIDEHNIATGYREREPVGQ